MSVIDLVILLSRRKNQFKKYIKLLIYIIFSSSCRWIPSFQKLLMSLLPTNGFDVIENG